MDGKERAELIRRYEVGPQVLREALATVPKEAMRWRPAPGKWSVHEVVCHCADSETNGAMRIRYLVGEDRPAIQGYDQDRWAVTFDYHQLSMELALQQVESVRRWTARVLRALPEAAWQRTGSHSQMPGEVYSAEGWLRIYAEHLEKHERQIRRNVEAYHAAGR
jgi:hypothetical protein